MDKRQERGAAKVEIEPDLSPALSSLAKLTLSFSVRVILAIWLVVNPAL